MALALESVPERLESTPRSHRHLHRLPVAPPAQMDVDDAADSDAADAGDSSTDLFERLNALDKAETLAAEDDLILRMSAVSKLRERKGAHAKEKKRSPSKFAADSKPKSGIGKRRTSRHGMAVESTSTQKHEAQRAER